jgi:ABC-type dipeptide/oligopeptide/nickel transport system permease component
MPLQRFLARRLVHAVPVLIGIATITFLMLHLIPGDPALIYAGDNPLGDELTAQIRRVMGLDRPLWVQYVDYLGRVARGDLGISMRHRGSVLDSILEALPGTIRLTLAAIAVAVTVGVVLGIIAAILQGTWLDTTVMTFAMVGVSMPTFYSGLLLILFFSFRLGWFPATGAEGIERLVLPALALGFSSAAVLARLVRSSMLEVLRQDYIVTARAKGLAQRVVVSRHALRNALIPTVTVLGLQFGHLMTGAVTTEIVFSRPGLGRLTVTSILGRDYTMVQGIVLFAAVVFLLVNLVIDVSYASMDPRVHYE